MSEDRPSEAISVATGDFVASPVADIKAPIRATDPANQDEGDVPAEALLNELNRAASEMVERLDRIHLLAQDAVNDLRAA